MLDYKEDTDAGIVEITVDGRITREEFDDVAAKLEALIASHGKIRILEIVNDFQGIETSAFWDDLKFSLRHLNDFSKCAVVSDKQWVNLWSTLLRPFISCEVEHFEPDEIEMARAWLAWPEGSADV